MDLFNSIPAPIWGLAVVAFAFWYVFMRGKRKTTRKSLNRLRREEEATKRELSIAKNKERLEEIKEKTRRKKGDFFK